MSHEINVCFFTGLIISEKDQKKGHGLIRKGKCAEIGTQMSQLLYTKHE